MTVPTLSTVKWREILAEVTQRAPELAAFTAKGFGRESTDVFWELKRGHRERFRYETGIDQGDVMGPDTFCK